MIEKPPKEISAQIREKESGVLTAESILTPRVISTMPDITPCESAVLSRFDANITLSAFDKTTKILVWFKMSIRTKKKEI